LKSGTGDAGVDAKSKLAPASSYNQSLIIP
jgi:hypothetical protein